MSFEKIDRYIENLEFNYENVFIKKSFKDECCIYHIVINGEHKLKNYHLIKNKLEKMTMVLEIDHSYMLTADKALLLIASSKPITKKDRDYYEACKLVEETKDLSIKSSISCKELDRILNFIDPNRIHRIMYHGYVRYIIDINDELENEIKAKLQGFDVVILTDKMNHVLKIRKHYLGQEDIKYLLNAYKDIEKKYGNLEN